MAWEGEVFQQYFHYGRKNNKKLKKNKVDVQTSFLFCFGGRNERLNLIDTGGSG